MMGCLRACMMLCSRTTLCANRQKPKVLLAGVLVMLRVAAAVLTKLVLWPGARLCKVLDQGPKCQLWCQKYVTKRM
jgi:hypothetical protein